MPQPAEARAHAGFDDLPECDDDSSVEGIDEREVFGALPAWRAPAVTEPLTRVCAATDLIRGLQDPEHPLTLEQLNVTRVRGARGAQSERRAPLTPPGAP